ncbi:MAG: DMT family transporter [Anaerolineales bacterium]|nr:DMT family transporter [Anaerolineales bacterium]
MSTLGSHIRGAATLALALLIFSLQDIAVKWIGGSYNVLEIVLIRSLVALPCTFLFLRLEGRRGLPTTTRPVLEYARGLLLFVSFTTYMMGLAALPLAEMAAIRNSGPLMITLLSVLWLGEQVGPRRWLALGVGFLGVLLIVQPGSAAFNPGALYALLATLTYALSVMVTRRLQTTDSSATMAYFSSLVYLGAAVALGPLSAVVGEQPGADASLAFLFRAWTVPTLLDAGVMAGLGLVWAGGMYFVARAYSLAPASVVAPFEYTALLISVMWGLLLWNEVPTWLTIIGASLTVGSGLYVLYRERRQKSRAPQADDLAPREDPVATG